MSDTNDAPALRAARLRAGCYRYAAADKSDPFALMRALTHLSKGFCNPIQDGKDGGYDADEFSEEAVTSTGAPFMRVVYRNVARP